MVVPFRRESAETDRLLALSDGVIAIAITLLVLDLGVPTAPTGSSMAVLSDLLLEQGEEFFGFVLSFLVIGQYWVLHRRVFVHVEAHDSGVVWLNLLFLLAVAFVPFAASVFSAYPGQFGVTVLSGVLASTGFTLAVTWIYASRRQLVEQGLTSRAVAIQATRFLASPLVFVISIFVATIDSNWGILTWFTLIPINAAFQTRLVANLEESVQEP